MSARLVRHVLPTIADPGRAAAALYDRVAGAGPLQRYLDDPEVEEIWINERLTEGPGYRLGLPVGLWAPPERAWRVRC